MITAVAWHLWQRLIVRYWLIRFLIVCFALSTVIFAIPRFYAAKRFLLLGWPYAILCIAWGTMQFGNWRINLWIGLLVLSLGEASVVLLFIPKDDWRGVVLFVNDHVPTGDVIWLDPPWNHLPFAYYAPD